MARHGLRREAQMALLVKVLLGVGVGMLAGGASMAVAAERETRVFAVKIDEKPAGAYHMTISRPDDRTFIVESRADVSASYLFIKYTYAYQGTEVWKDGRLAELRSKTNDDGKQFEVLAQADGETLRVRVNGKEHTTRPDVWTTTYWRLPDPRLGSQAVALLDCDTGKDLRGTVQYVGTQQLTVAGQAQDCTHYRIRGDVQADAWYDGRQRLVRQEAIEGGHRTVLELARIDR